jgi:ribosomal protein S18 acetylase RimI-like enzyme
LSFTYFAYGSNLWLPQIRSRCPSAQVVGTARLDDWALVCDKPSVDGSAKLNIRPSPGASVDGVIYDIEDGEKDRLDAAEPGYTPIHVELDDGWTLTYTYEGPAADDAPYDWYMATARAGARYHGFPEPMFTAKPDPLAPGLRPAEPEDLETILGILSSGLADSDRYHIHPGDYGWWVFHDDPRHPDHFSTWLKDDDVLITIDSIDPFEINVFTRPGLDRMPYVRWAQRRLEGKGDVGWVIDRDAELVDALSADGYVTKYAFRLYQWDLSTDLPDVVLPDGWEIRPVSGEEEADNRRQASHLAFESTMEPTMHLQRYIDFMRSPVYVADRDLVAVAPDGTIVSFVVWWGDESSGVAQIEPFGTHPGYHRLGIGRALIYQALAEMKRAGMTTARVCTEDDRPATGFYEGVGFEDVGRLRWWGLGSTG